MSDEFDNVELRLPDGTYLRAAAIEGESFPAINIYLVSADRKLEDLVCFVEYNPEREKTREVSIGVYQDDKEDTVYYDSFVAERHQYSYSIDDYNLMTIWEDDCVLCTVSDVHNEEQAKTLLQEIVFELRGVVLKDEDQDISD